MSLDAISQTCKHAAGSLEQIYAAAEMLALVTQTITYFNGSRINDYAPFFAIAQHVCTKLDAMKAGGISRMTCKAPHSGNYQQVATLPAE